MQDGRTPDRLQDHERVHLERILLAAQRYGFSYVRLAPVLTADCERGVIIKWHGTIN
jgi:hypothetical protein